jgi:arginyl-tRNA synthetase
MLNEIEKKLHDVIKDIFDLEVAALVEIPALKEHGDYSTGIALRLAKPVGKAPMEIASTIKSAFENVTFLDRVEVAAPGFINFHIDTVVLATTVLTSIYENELIAVREDPQKIIVEHTSVNPNKAMHVGHIRNAILGDSISRLLTRVGHTVEVHNYIDDTGVQVADTVNGLMNLDLVQPQGQKFDDFCWDVYTEINKQYEKNGALVENRKGLLHSIEAGDNDIAEKSEEIVDAIVGCHLDIMAAFNIFYDLLVYESDIIGFGFWETAFEQLKNSENFVYSTEGDNKDCWVLKYDTDKFGDKIFVRSDGTKVYTAKDTAYHLWKFGLLNKNFLYKEWDNSHKLGDVWRTCSKGDESATFGRAEKIINVIDDRQTYPQEMVKHALHSLGYTNQAENYTHIAYGVVSLSKETAEVLGVDVSDNKNTYAMSGRKGIGVKITDLLKLLTDEVEKIQADSPSADATETTVSAQDIAIGAIKHYMLKNNPISEVLFDFNQALQLVGNTGPYLQYSHARAASILKKAGDFPVTYSNESGLSEFERALISQFSELPIILDKVLEDFNISLLANYAFSLSKSFHAFYEHNNVMQAKPDIKNFRLTLVQGYTKVISEVLDILGIVAPEKM